MNTETLLRHRIEQQSDIICLLKKENVCLIQIIQAYLLDNFVPTQSERELITSLVERSGSNISFGQKSEGINIKNTFPAHSAEGISIKNNSSARQAEGKSGKNSFLRTGSEANNKEYIARVAAQMRSFMKYATELSLVNTVLILCHLHSNPATPLPQLRRLTGLSEGGMAKRIMALKRTGFIVRQNAPLRYVVTENAARLMEEKK